MSIACKCSYLRGFIDEIENSFYTFIFDFQPVMPMWYLRSRLLKYVCVCETIVVGGSDGVDGATGGSRAHWV